jgi:hypothetical protein
MPGLESESAPGCRGEMRNVSSGKAKARFRLAATAKLHGCGFAVKMVYFQFPDTIASIFIRNWNRASPGRRQKLGFVMSILALLRFAPPEHCIGTDIFNDKMLL